MLACTAFEKIIDDIGEKSLIRNKTGVLHQPFTDETDIAAIAGKYLKLETDYARAVHNCSEAFVEKNLQKQNP